MSTLPWGAPVAMLWAADWEVIIKVGMFIVFIGFSLVNQAIQAMRKAQAQRPPRPIEPPRDFGRRVEPDPMQVEIEEFLRRAAGQQRTSSPPTPTMRPGANTPGQRPGAKPNKQVRRRGKKGNAEPLVMPEVVEPSTTSRRPMPTLTDHISSRHLEARMDNDPLGSAAAVPTNRAGEQSAGSFQVPAAGDPLSTMAASLADAATGSDASNAGGVALALRFNDLDQIRYAFLVSEVFRRPEERW